MYRLFCQFLVVFFGIGLIVGGVGILTYHTGGEMLFWAIVATAGSALCVTCGIIGLREPHNKRRRR